MADSSMTIEQINARTKKYIEDNVPYQWSHVVCKCLTPKYDNQALTCLDCGKIARWRLQRCEFCREKFVKGGFTHHAYKAGERIKNETTGRMASPLGMCFDCLVEHFGEEPGDALEVTFREPPKITESSFESIDFEDFTL